MKFTTKVLLGWGRGKTLGFPTFNLKIPANLTIKHGIYAGWVWIKTKKYAGAFHYGPIPVFNQPGDHLEVFVLNYQSNRSLHKLTFELVHYLRPIKNFASPQDLAAQISLDVSQAEAMLH